jgi:vang-like
MEIQHFQLICGVECDGALVSMAFKLFTLVVGSWAVFLRPSRATLPRVRVYRALVCLLILVFLVSFWLFYVNHVVKEAEIVTYKSLVAFAVQLVSSGTLSETQL